MSLKTTQKMREYHRYLGFFLAGIMAMYAISGMVLIFRTTDFLKREVHQQEQLAPGLTGEQVGRELRIRDLKVNKTEGDVLFFENGTYNSITGEAQFVKKELPFVLGKMTQIHKANTNQPLFYLNIFFGLSLLFFVVSAFWMFQPKTSIFKKGLYFALGGMALVLVLIFI